MKEEKAWRGEKAKTGDTPTLPEFVEVLALSER
jgi:hypothetical protein